MYPAHAYLNKVSPETKEIPKQAKPCSENPMSKKEFYQLLSKELIKARDFNDRVAERNGL